MPVCRDIGALASHSILICKSAKFLASHPIEQSCHMYGIFAQHFLLILVENLVKIFLGNYKGVPIRFGFAPCEGILQSHNLDTKLPSCPPYAGVVLNPVVECQFEVGPVCLPEVLGNELAWQPGSI